MLSVGAMGGGKINYYLNLIEEDYYLSGEAQHGLWWGSGAGEFSLSGEIEDHQHVRNLFRGFSPEGGRALVQNAGEGDRRSGFDFTFSAPKAVSALWSQAIVEVREEVEAAHQKAVEAALGYLESMAVTRRGKGGGELERCGLSVALFRHGTSRAQDPQLHTHALLLNVARRPDGTTGTLDYRPLLRAKMAAGALYRAELAAQLERRLAVEVLREKEAFTLGGVPASLIEEFSTRRQEIKEGIEKTGARSAKAAAKVAIETRLRKGEASSEELFSSWKEAGAKHGFDLCGVLNRSVRALDERHMIAESKKTINHAIKRLTESSSHFSKRELVRFAAEEAQGRGIGTGSLIGAVDEHLEHSKGIVRLGEVESEPRFTTREMLSLEKALLFSAEALSRKLVFDVSVRGREAVKAVRTLSREQAGALDYLTTASGHLACVSGMAGTGKTYLLDAAREVWERSGYRVIGAALSAKAAKGLEDGAKIKSMSVAKALWLLDKRGIAAQIKENLSLRTIARHVSLDSFFRGGKLLYDKKWGGGLKLEKKSVLVVDEAGMVDTPQMARLIAHVEKAGAKLVLVGDERQLQPIGPGAPFRAITKRTGSASLNKIIRQRAGWAKKAVQDISAGRAGKALKAYEERGLVKVSRNKRGSIKKLVSEWRDLPRGKVGETLVFASTREEARELNELCQRARRERGEISPKGIKVGERRFSAGDHILFMRNFTARGLSGHTDVQNGTLAQVLSVSPLRGKMKVRLQGGKVFSFSVREYTDIELGYAMTTHKAQGVTVERALVLTGGRMTDRELSYVKASRARGETRIYTDRVEAGAGLKDLKRQMETSRAKDLAQDHKQDLGPELTP